MSCSTPWLKKMPDGSLVPIPCGKCPACLRDRRNEWTWRTKAEIADKDAIFLTLTIDDEHLRGPSLNVESTKRFWKRLRKALGPERRFKYLCVGEYGSLDMRPHYHAILIGLSCGMPLSRDVGDVPVIRKCWPFGFIKAVPASTGSIRYVLKYLDKQLSDDEWQKKYPELVKPFKTSSKGLGIDWLYKNLHLLNDKNQFFFDGKFRPLPRYYKEKLGISKPNRDDYSDVSVFSRLVSNPGMRDKVEEYMNRYDVPFDVALYNLGKQDLKDFESQCLVNNKVL